MKFKRKELIVDGIQYDGDNVKEISDFAGGKIQVPKGFAYLLIPYPSEQRNQVLHVGSWVTKRENGDLKVVTLDDFKDEYEKVI